MIDCGDLRGRSITYRIALGPNAGRKAITHQTILRFGDD